VIVEVLLLHYAVQSSPTFTFMSQISTKMFLIMTKYDALHQTRQIVKVFVVEKKEKEKVE